jgi:hypothetical protein
MAAQVEAHQGGGISCQDLFAPFEFIVAMFDETLKRDVLTTYCRQNTFMEDHREISTYLC